MFKPGSRISDIPNDMVCIWHVRPYYKPFIQTGQYYSAWKAFPVCCLWQQQSFAKVGKIRDKTSSKTITRSSWLDSISCRKHLTALSRSASRCFCQHQFAGVITLFLRQDNSDPLFRLCDIYLIVRCNKSALNGLCKRGSRLLAYWHMAC